MGTWDAGPFDNDDATDWAHEFEHADATAGLAIIDTTLRTAVQYPADDYMDSDDGAPTVAAAALLAHIVDGEPSGNSERDDGNDAFTWAARTRPVLPPELLDLAIHALDRVTAANSELASLWAEAGPGWRSSIDALANRLRPAGQVR